MFVSPITEKTRTFPVAFQGKTFYVDPNILASYSRRFRRIYNPNNIQLSQLSIVGEYFHESVVEEFLKLCQLESPQIPDLDLPEIAGLAYVFEADKVKESVLSHILSKDPTFIFNENALKNSNIIFSTINHFNHTLDIDQLEFEEDGKATAISNSSSDDNSSGHSNHSEPNLHQMENHHHKHDSNSSGSNHNHIPHSLSENKHNPATYQIILERHALKCTKYWLCLAGETLMAAKSKMLYAAIGNGSEIHLKDHSKIIC
ncbi:hypothetical protein TRFO_17212 [Tritrichomonas foetus]|uniref:BTB domain-containing protein n=1 Tax=Tritrichomonas foetus TaxID=1144522 RepID=A0A1J4KNF1_9EUKA|nr:hypothetical protein TRFO_17212 [Tritrichomonas foetus]|eukprot:OHT12841.1 hypothetical protein TRFO_17212 [Tritrichomonas foetus]